MHKKMKNKLYIIEEREEKDLCKNKLKCKI